MNNNKTALIIGGSSGIGLATAKLYQKYSLNVIIVGKNEENLKSAIQNLTNTQYFLADIMNLESLKNLSKELQNQKINIDILVVSAGMGKFGSVYEVSEEDYDSVMNTNVKGTFFAVQILSERINTNGNIVLLSSFLASKYLPLTSVLAASKVAVETFTKIFAREFKDRSIRVNAVSPGSIKTNFMNIAKPSEDIQKRLTENMPQIPMGKRGEAEEIADAILFLTSENASYINGSILSVDGGLSIA